MSLTKTPFILLATWAFDTSTMPPNPPSPKHEAHRVTSSSGKCCKHPMGGHYHEREHFENYSAGKQPLNRPYSGFLPLLR